MNFDFDILQCAIDTAICMDIRDIAKEEHDNQTVQSVDTVSVDEVVIDIRTPDEIEDSPLNMEADVIEMPFCRLSTNFSEFDQSKTHLLYCQRGVMSGLQAMTLKSKGFDNIKILKLE